MYLCRKRRRIYKVNEGNSSSSSSTKENEKTTLNRDDFGSRTIITLCTAKCNHNSIAMVCVCARAKSIQYTHTIDVLIISEWVAEADCLLAAQAFLTYRISLVSSTHNVEDTQTEKSERKCIYIKQGVGIKNQAICCRCRCRCCCFITICLLLLKFNMLTELYSSSEERGERQASQSVKACE